MVAPGLSHILTAEKEKKKRKLVLRALVKKFIWLSRLFHLATPPRQKICLLSPAHTWQIKK
jgi:hypothetical protein